MTTGSAQRSQLPRASGKGFPRAPADGSVRGQPRPDAPAAGAEAAHPLAGLRDGELGPRAPSGGHCAPARWGSVPLRPPRARQSSASPDCAASLAAASSSPKPVCLSWSSAGFSAAQGRFSRGPQPAPAAGPAPRPEPLLPAAVVGAAAPEQPRACPSAPGAPTARKGRTLPGPQWRQPGRHQRRVTAGVASRLRRLRCGGGGGVLR